MLYFVYDFNNKQILLFKRFGIYAVDALKHRCGDRGSRGATAPQQSDWGAI